MFRQARFGEYVIDQPLGSGGMATVLGGIHEQSGLAVAIKVMHGQASGDALRRFRQELRAHASLQHPHVVHIFDFGELERDYADAPGLVAGKPFIVMERGQGIVGDLAVDDWNAVRRIAAQVLLALGHAHARGIIHRDVKPANMLLVDGDVKLADFGIAQAISSRVTVADLDELTSFAGTPDYMPPEQALGRWREVGPWTDLYALGCVVFELVAGERPFTSASALETVMRHTRGERSVLRPRFAVPPGLYPWLDVALATAPQDRFRRANEALTALPGTVRTDESPPTRWSGAALAATEQLTVQLASLGAEDSRGALVVAPHTTTEGPTLSTSIAVPRFVGAGLGLFGLRAPPFVDRDAEREMLHGRLNSRTGFDLVVIDGPAGVGKSRLAEWLCQLAHEETSALVLRCSTGLRDMLDDFLRTRLLDGEQLFELLRGGLPRLGDDDGGVDRDARALADYLRPTNARRVDELRDQLLLLERVFRRFRVKRPIVLSIDDLHADEEALGLVEHLAGSEHAPDMLVAATLRADLVAEDSTLSARVLALTKSPEVRALHLEPLTRDDACRLIEGMLPVNETAIASLAERMEGNPLFGIQLLSHWIDQSQVRIRGKHLQFDSDPRELPSTIHALWLERIGALLSTFPEPDAVGAQLEIAAVLGRDVDRAEWEKACELAGRSPTLRIWEIAADRGLVTSIPNGWRFAHSLLMESLQRIAADGGRARDHHRLCARAIESTHGTQENRLARIGRHWLAAEEPERALQPLFEAASRRINFGDPRGARSHLLLRRDALNALGVGADDERSLQNEIEFSLTTLDDYSTDLRKVTDLYESAVRTGSAELQCGGAHLIARTYDWAGDSENAILWTKRRLDVAREHELSDHLDSASMTLGWLRFQRGELLEASEQFHALHLRAATAVDIARSGHALATVMMSRGDVSGAQLLFEEVLEQASIAGVRATVAHCRNSLGELARLADRFEEAENHYHAVASLSDELGLPLEREGANLNLLFVALARHDFERARELRTRVQTRCAELGFHGFDSYLDVTEMVLDASTGLWARVRRHLDRFAANLDRVEMDHAWLLELTGDIAGSGSTELARGAYERAGAIWTQLENEVGAKRAARKASQIDAAI